MKNSLRRRLNLPSWLSTLLVSKRTAIL